MTGVGDPARGFSGTRLRAAPNPCFGGTAIRVDAGATGEERLLVCDLLGRTVRHLQSGSFAPGSRDVPWDGRDDRGARLAAGVYLVVLQSTGRTYQTRVILLQ